MKTLDEIYQIVEESSHETAFNFGECEALYNFVQKVPHNGVVVEVGVEYGRSTTVIAEAQKEIGFKFFAIDNFCQENGPEAQAHVNMQTAKHEWQLVLVPYSSLEASTFKYIPKKIDFVHIDGDHSYEAVKSDISLWVPRVKKGGYAAFDDYGHDSLEGVWEATQEYFSDNDHWKFIGRYGNKLGIFQRI